VKLVVDEGDTTFRRKPKLPDVEPDTGFKLHKSLRKLLFLIAAQEVGSCCSGGTLRSRA
jgi:hypothetical protein